MASKEQPLEIAKNGLFYRLDALLSPNKQCESNDCSNFNIKN